MFNSGLEEIQISQKQLLVGGSTHLKNICQIAIISPGRGETEKYLKPPPRSFISSILPAIPQKLDLSTGRMLNGKQRSSASSNLHMKKRDLRGHVGPKTGQQAGYVEKFQH